MSTNRDHPVLLDRLSRTIIGCQRCPRLRSYCEHISKERRRAFAGWEYWGKPLPGFGDPYARVLVVGLAPAAHGGTRTGRIFCGDSSGDWLIKALYETGFANQPTSTHKGDGLKLSGVYLTAVVRCAPPQNKPTKDETQNCLPYLREELRILRNISIVLVLGRIALDGFIRVLQDDHHLRVRPRPRFEHGANYNLGNGLPKLYVSYHPSRRNTQTKTLTWPMWVRTFKIIRRQLNKSATQ